MIKEFKGPHFFLSNFYISDVYYLGYTWPSSEHAYQAAKFHPHRPDIWAKIITEPEPAVAKRIARRFKLDQRPDWLQVNEQIMFDILRSKFSEPKLMSQLLATQGEYLQEGNTWGDAYWGVDLYSGRGENKLGRLLMRLRDGR